MNVKLTPSKMLPSTSIKLASFIFQPDINLKILCIWQIIPLLKFSLKILLAEKNFTTIYFEGTTIASHLSLTVPNWMEKYPPSSNMVTYL